MTRIESEKNTVAKMVRIYCKYHEHNKHLCDNCHQLLEYAYQRLNYCKYGETKPTCRKCPIHCYKPDMREKMRAVMRFAGPRMIFFHPIIAIRHLWAERN